MREFFDATDTRLQIPHHKKVARILSQLNLRSRETIDVNTLLQYIEHNPIRQKTRSGFRTRTGDDTMVALLKDNGEFTPMPVVVDTKKFEELKDALEKPAMPPKALIELIRANKRSAAR